MKVLWDRGPSPARDIHAALEGERDWSPKTVKTLLGRLVAKGAVDYQQVANAYVYRARVPLEALVRSEVKEFVDRVADARPAFAAMQFLRSAELTREDIGRLRALLEEKERSLETRRRRAEP